MIDPSIILGALSVLIGGAIAIKLGLHSDCRIDTTAERMSQMAPQPITSIRLPLIEEEETQEEVEEPKRSPTKKKQQRRKSRTDD